MNLFIFTYNIHCLKVVTTIQEILQNKLIYTWSCTCLNKINCTVFYSRPGGAGSDTG